MSSEQRETDEISLMTYCLGSIGLAMVVVGLLSLALKSSVKNNQIVRPIPGVPQPVVDGLPILIEKLETAKKRAESRAAAVKEAIDLRMVSAAKGIHGRVVYGDAASAFDALIGYIDSAMERRFKWEDGEAIASRLVEAEKAKDDYLAWSDTVLEPLTGELEFGAASEIVNAWLDRVSRENAEAKKALSEKLNRCRWRGWDELGGSTRPRPN